MTLTAEQIIEMKSGGQRIVMLTSYDFPTAQTAAACGVDILLVGDSVGTNVLGYSSVEQVTLDDMIHHVKAVARGAGNAFVLCDLPFKTFTTPSTALDSARKCIDAGAHGVKMEGEEESIEQLRHVAAAGIPVCAHIGYTPQTDGARATVQGKDTARALELLAISRSLEQAGAFMIVLELIPMHLAALITHRLHIPTIGIGAGPSCDGQVQVVHDIAGFSNRVYRHAKAFGSAGEQLRGAIQAYAGAVHSGAFPTQQNAAAMSDDVLREIREQLDTTKETGQA